jgi:hypothetical protein
MRDGSISFNRNLDCEMVHLYEPKNETVIKSTGRNFKTVIDGKHHNFSIPLSFWGRLFSVLRICRRLFRLDKSNAVLNFERDGVIVLYRGNIWYFCLKDKTLNVTGSLKNCRNVLHGGIAVIREGIYFAEYGENKNRQPVDVLCSKDGGSSWAVIHSFPRGSIKHAHGVYFDPYGDQLWIPTGDFEGECFMVCADFEFKNVVMIGDGSQKWRGVGMFFTESEVIWGMDSPLETSYIQSLNRKTLTLTQGQSMPGPVWYTKHLSDGIALIQTSVEIGPGVLDNSSYIFASEDMVNWVPVSVFEKDSLPMRYFKWGVIAFSDGKQDSTDFTFSGEALKGLDGLTYSGKLILDNKLRE